MIAKDIFVKGKEIQSIRYQQADYIGSFNTTFAEKMLAMEFVPSTRKIDETNGGEEITLGELYNGLSYLPQTESTFLMRDSEGTMYEVNTRYDRAYYGGWHIKANVALSYA